MNIMNIPGFTAGAALLPVTKLYFRSSAETTAQGMVITQAPPGGLGTGGTGESCTARCEREKNECRDMCDINDCGYFGFFDCRLTYAACLAGCVIHGNTSGGIVIA
ncbi:MAG: hypothetical protein R2932_37820 [Caldilineaceae bacterium]